MTAALEANELTDRVAVVATLGRLSSTLVRPQYSVVRAARQNRDGGANGQVVYWTALARQTPRGDDEERLQVDEPGR